MQERAASGSGTHPLPLLAIHIQRPPHAALRAPPLQQAAADGGPGKQRAVDGRQHGQLGRHAGLQRRQSRLKSYGGLHIACSTDSKQGQQLRDGRIWCLQSASGICHPQEQIPQTVQPQAQTPPASHPPVCTRCKHRPDTGMLRDMRRIMLTGVSFCTPASSPPAGRSPAGSLVVTAPWDAARSLSARSPKRSSSSSSAGYGTADGRGAAKAELAPAPDMSVARKSTASIAGDDAAAISRSSACCSTAAEPAACRAALHSTAAVRGLPLTPGEPDAAASCCARGCAMRGGGRGLPCSSSQVARCSAALALSCVNACCSHCARAMRRSTCAKRWRVRPLPSRAMTSGDFTSFQICGGRGTTANARVSRNALVRLGAWPADSPFCRTQVLTCTRRASRVDQPWPPPGRSLGATFSSMRAPC
jgi:hypothetical protein